MPLLIGISGLNLMAIGALAASSTLAETAWTVTGSLLLAGAHIVNWRRGLSGDRDTAQ